jgi:hypothetical protein
MRRKAGIVLGACAALVLTGSAGAVAWGRTGGEGQPVGFWHEPPSVTRTPVAVAEPVAPAAPPAAPGAVAQGAGAPAAHQRRPGARGELVRRGQPPPIH